MNYSSACRQLDFEANPEHNISTTISQLLLRYYVKNKTCNNLQKARDFILFPLVKEQVRTGRINIQHPMKTVTCPDCKGSGNIWNFEKVTLSIPCKECAKKGLDYQCKRCGNTGYIKKFKSTGRIEKVIKCKKCDGEGTLDTKMFNPAIKFNNRLKLQFQSMI